MIRLLSRRSCNRRRWSFAVPKNLAIIPDRHPNPLDETNLDFIPFIPKFVFGFPTATATLRMRERAAVVSTRDIAAHSCYDEPSRCCLPDDRTIGSRLSASRSGCDFLVIGPSRMLFDSRLLYGPSYTHCPTSHYGLYYVCTNLPSTNRTVPQGRSGRTGPSQSHSTHPSLCPRLPFLSLHSQSFRTSHWHGMDLDMVTPYELVIHVPGDPFLPRHGIVGPCSIHRASVCHEMFLLSSFGTSSSNLSTETPIPMDSRQCSFPLDGTHRQR